MPDQIAALEAQLDVANFQIKDLEAQNKESQRRIKAATVTVKRVKEGRDRIYLRYAKQNRLLQNVCNDLSRAENADVRAITVCELNNWLHENENPEQAETKLDEEIAESLKRAAPLLAILQQVVEMIDLDASVRGHVPQRWESIYERAREILSDSPERQVRHTGQCKTSLAEQVMSAMINLPPKYPLAGGTDADPLRPEEFFASFAALDPPEFKIKGAHSQLPNVCDDE